MEWTIANSAKGYLALAFLTWFVMFGVLLCGILLRRRILAWDEEWRRSVEEGGRSLKDWAESVEATFRRIRATARLLGFFLAGIILLMGLLLYLGLGGRTFFGLPQIANGLWLLSLVALAVVLPAFVCFAVGAHLSEIMLLKANDFLQMDEKQEVHEKKARIRGVELAKRLKAERDAQKAQPAQPAQPAS